jgi:hypothetical protein
LLRPAAEARAEHPSGDGDSSAVSPHGGSPTAWSVCLGAFWGSIFRNRAMNREYQARTRRMTRHPATQAGTRAVAAPVHPRVGSPIAARRLTVSEFLRRTASAPRTNEYGCAEASASTVAMYPGSPRGGGVSFATQPRARVHVAPVRRFMSARPGAAGENPNRAGTRVSRFINIFSCGERFHPGVHTCML